MRVLPLWRGESHASNFPDSLELAHPAPLRLCGVRARRARGRRGGDAMSRAVNIDATMEAVVAMSAKHKAGISAIEPLMPSGTRVIFNNADDAAVIARAYGKSVLTGPVTRQPWRQQRVD
jgi:hypothetical protein